VAAQLAAPQEELSFVSKLSNEDVSEKGGIATPFLTSVLDRGVCYYHNIQKN
jgi:hypothetical protein